MAFFELYSWLFSMLRVFTGEILIAIVMLDITCGSRAKNFKCAVNVCFFYEILIVLTLWLAIVIVIL